MKDEGDKMREKKKHQSFNLMADLRQEIKRTNLIYMPSIHLIVAA